MLINLSNYIIQLDSQNGNNLLLVALSSEKLLLEISFTSH